MTTVTRRRFIGTLAALPVLVLLRANTEPNPIKADEVIPSLSTPKANGHGATNPSRRGVGPLRSQRYVDMTIRPPVHGYSVMEFTREDRTTDVFKVRTRIDEVLFEPEEQPDSRPLAAAITLRELDPKPRPKSPTAMTMVFKDVLRVVDGREIEVKEFDVSVDIARSDINESMKLDRIDQTLFTPPEVTVLWREVVYIPQ